MSEHDTATNTKPISKPNTPLSLSPWIALLVAIVLCVGIIGGIFSNYHGAASTMKKILLEKGASLIRSFEAGARMRMRHASDIRLQLLLEEMASREDIHFTAVISGEGIILAHSDPNLIGMQLLESTAVQNLHALKNPQSEIITLDEVTSFVVYEYFNPMQGAPDAPHSVNINNSDTMRNLHKHESPPDKHGGLPDRPKEFWDTITSLRGANTQGSIMLVGLSMDPLLLAEAQDKRTRTLIIILLLGSAVLSALALWRFQKERQALGKASLALDQASQSLAKESLALEKERQAQEQVLKLQAEIRQREKQAAMGHLAAGVAHELRNPLSSIKGYATYFGTRFPEGSEDRHAAAIMVQEVDRLNRVITDLINLAKPSDLRLIEHDASSLRLLVDRALRLIQHEALARGVTVHFDTQDLSPTTKAHIDPDRFLQALLNVWLNALDAFTSLPSTQAHNLYVTLRTSPQSHFSVITRDTGSGIAPEQLSKICDPYFTTKPQGTGLGLAIVQKIIEAHGGRMDVRSEVGVGTSVEFVV